MQIRLMGNKKLVERIKSFTNQKTKIYSNRNSDEVRLFINIDDQKLKQWLDLIENCQEILNNLQVLNTRNK